jgi:hypothetical protein
LTKQIKTLKKLVSALQAHQEDSNDDSSLSSEDGDAHFQYACAAIEATNPKVAMALQSLKGWDLDLRSVWLLDNQSTFDLCCNPDLAGKRRNAKQAMNNGEQWGWSVNFHGMYGSWIWFLGLVHNKGND